MHERAVMYRMWCVRNIRIWCDKTNAKHNVKRGIGRE